jgi:hypothetical protein
MKLWNWLDGKKTIIAVLIYAISSVVNYFYPDTQIAEWLEIIASVFGGTGLTHKYFKRVKNEKD